ncbi:hypothetical protein [Filomicrobium sp.]|uniref:cobaltochelatase CobT-related protein n=1 Tax=Filomicrobium sp. TaxID=2024831 RepID=UPI002589AF7A|nr:hypothetical protein [Filomicrobium sp.]
MNRKAGTGPEHKSNRGFVVAADSGAVIAAGVAISVAVALENCGATVEILGFTTGEWCGGKSRQDWLKAGKPSRPGRLNDLLHIIYKRADETSVAACSQRLEWLLYPHILKENIDGEAIAWARARLLARPASDRLLIVVSDGAPVDDSTLHENGPRYLDHHLTHVIEELERHNDPRIVGIGIGYDVSRYISKSVTIKGDGSSLEQQLPTIANLIAGSIEKQSPSEINLLGNTDDL